VDSHSRDLGIVPSPVQSVIVVNNLRPGGAIRGISGTLGRGGGGESAVAIQRFSMW
jgi:hypothetical protein